MPASDTHPSIYTSSNKGYDKPGSKINFTLNRILFSANFLFPVYSSLLYYGIYRRDAYTDCTIKPKCKVLERSMALYYKGKTCKFLFEGLKFTNKNMGNIQIHIQTALQQLNDLWWKYDWLAESINKFPESFGTLPGILKADYSMNITVLCTDIGFSFTHHLSFVKQII